MKQIILTIAFSFIIFGCLTKKEAEKDKVTQPNIIFILADDLGWADLPSYGNTFNEAPNIEKLASEGIQFYNAYATNPVCSPTRASIQTGQYPARIGIDDFIPGHWRPFEKLIVPANKTQYLPSSYETMGETLQSAGYKTGYFGKWHLGFTEECSPKNQGYDESVVYNGGGFFDYNNLMSPKTNFPEGTVLAEGLTNLSINFIDKNKNQPFFLFLSHYDVHVQLEAQDALIKKYINKPKAKGYPSNAVYASMIENIDTSVGSIMKKLEELNIDNHTIIVFFSDNGGLVKRFDKIPLIAKRNSDYYKNDSLLYIASSNKPLRGEKGTVFEGGIRVPLIIKWPRKIKAGSTSDALVSAVDFFPTFVEISDAKKTNQITDGKSIVPEITGKNRNTERALFWHYPIYHHGVPASAVRKGDWKLIYFFDDKHAELYNLKDDIGETKNVFHFEKQKGDELLALLNNWHVSVKAQLPIENPGFDEKQRKKWGTHPDRKSVDSIIATIAAKK